jgi:hypothetical protein
VNTQKFDGWIEIEDGKRVKFDDLAMMMAEALHPGDADLIGAEWVYLEGTLLNAGLSGELVVRELGRGRLTCPTKNELKRAVIFQDDLRPFLEAGGIGLRIIPLTTADDAMPVSTPQPAPASGPVTPAAVWLVEALEIAKLYIDRHREQDLFPSQSDVCGHVARKLRENRIFGSHSKPLSAAYIGRNAIQGEWWKQNKP